MQGQGADKLIPRTKSKVLVVISRVFSFILHPLFMTLAALLVLWKVIPGQFSQISQQRFGRWIRELTLYTVLLPLVSILLFRVSGLISNALMHRPKDRSFPLVATMIFYCLAYWAFRYQHHGPRAIQSLLLGSASAIVIIFFVNLIYKVSVHTAGAAILPGILLAHVLNNEVSSIAPLSMAILVALFVGIIRWLLGAHTLGQIILGYTIGILTQLGAYFFVNY